MSLLPWPSLLSQAIGLGIGPASFWEVSVAEWRALAAPDLASAEVMTRANLTLLSLRFPDQETPPNDINE
ncbi:MAG: phage tail assembly chaperone [Hyphomonadaceae bacterium]|jgi:hypothetical protein|uniref:phage tail assembly chaperone n=1 Tax=Aquidulcibacter sp. TaxID=2052990 RepID=UPI0022BD690A|nr:phage tail assembly chaperone [Aquidulcibacter sp.]MCE2890339.1 phage tail assembly chaperone [Hyphomonadaceae bacterium]MCZ8210055.1 phage tail assembly chaperone [Aquidulcibacter sp.]